MKSAAYWKKRAAAVMDAGLEEAEKAITRLNRAYHAAARSIEGEISALFNRYATKQGLTYADALRDLTGKEYREWRMTLEDYVDRINATNDADLLRELDALSARSRITRYQEVLTEIKVQAAELAQKQQEAMDALLAGAYENSYYQTAFDVQKGLGFGKTLSALPMRAAAEAAAYPWSGASFSDRIWRNKGRLVQALGDILTEGQIRGDGERELTAKLQARVDSGRKDAERLMRTETARVVESAGLKAYEDCEIEEYEILVTLDNRTCPVCGKVDGKRYKTDEARTGLNLPPLHPNCRCTTVPVFEGLDESVSLRAARDEDGGYQLVPGNMTFEQWRQQLIMTLPKTTPANNMALPIQMGFRDDLGKMRFIPKETEITDVHIIAGKGTSTPFRDAEAKAKVYGGSVMDWQKKVGKIESDRYIFDIHWTENSGTVHEFKIKNKSEKKK